MTARAALLFPLLLLTVCPPAPAQEKSVAAPTTFDPERIDAFAAARVKDKGFVGLSLAVVKDGKLVLARGYGSRDRERGLPVDSNTRFAIGSVTKQFTCAAALILAEEGKLSVQDKVAKYYPKLTRAGDITLHDLMSHASGYPDYYPLDFVDRRLMKPIPLDQLLAEYAGGKLDFEPGTHWSYSNTGYILLGRIIEKVSGESFPAFVEKRLLKPAGMTQSGFDPKKFGDQTAIGYTSFALSEPEPAIPEADGWLHAAGGLWCTASDLAKWDLALMTGKIVKPESYRLMTTPRELANGKVKNYGCGLSIFLRANETLLRHGGAVSGFHASNTLLPRTKSAVVVLSNADHVSDSSIPEAIVSALLRPDEGPDVTVPKIDGPSPRVAARELVRQLQKGEVDRSKLGEEYSLYLSAEKVKGAAARLAKLGEPTGVEVVDVSERGGLEVSVTRVTFKDGTTLRGLMYRSPDGKIQQFFLNK